MTNNEGEALRWAIEFFSHNADELDRNNGARLIAELNGNSFLSRWDLEAEIRSRGEPIEGVETCATAIVEMISENKQYTPALDHFVASLVERGDKLPEAFQKFVASRLRSPPKPEGRSRGPKPETLVVRDLIIGAAVIVISDNFGLTRTRNRASKHSSATSIAKSALDKTVRLNMTESEVERAVARFTKRIGRIFRYLPNSEFHLNGAIIRVRRSR